MHIKGLLHMCKKCNGSETCAIMNYFKRMKRAGKSTDRWIYNNNKWELLEVVSQSRLIRFLEKVMLESMYYCMR